MGLADKLKLKQAEPLMLVNVPAELIQLFDNYNLQTDTAPVITQLLLFAKDKFALDKGFPALAERLQPQSLVWIAYPKKSGSIKTDISRDNGWETITAAGYEPVTAVAIDGDWSALRFKPSVDIKGKIRDTPMHERQTEGIDYINRTTTLPADVRSAMKAHNGLDAFFETLPFTHRKEHIEAIADAKKPETRQRRITKMIEMLLDMQSIKAGKNKTK